MTARSKGRPAASRAPTTRHERRARERAERKAAPKHPWVLPALAAVFLVSGSAGLVHEVVWARLLGRLFGATSLAVSTVLAAFMGGLALGSWWVGRRVERLVDRRRTYALLEIGIGVTALAVPLLLYLVEPLYGLIWRRFHLSFATFSILRFVVAAAVLLPPTAMMGATLPVLADYLAALQGRRLTPQWLYTVNLAGAVLGVALAGFVLMPAFGLWGTIIAGAAINVAAGLIVLRLPPLQAEPPTSAVAAPEVGRVPALLLTAALFSGVTSLATQVAWTRVLVLVIGSTTYAFSTVLLAYLAALAAGSALASHRGARIDDVRPDLAIAHLLMGTCMVGAVWAMNRVPWWYLDLFEVWKPESLFSTVAMNTLIVAGILFVPVLFAGMILPLSMVGALPREARGTGAVVGGLYAVNTVGAIVGAILAGFVILPIVGSQATLLGVAALAVALGIVFAAVSRRRALVGLGLGAVAVVAVGAVLRPAWQQRELNAAVFEPARLSSQGLADESEKLMFHREGATATVVVGEHDSGFRSLRINGRINASDAPIDMPTQVLLAQLPLMLAPQAADVFLLGWGSGITAGAALRSPIKQLTVVELEPAVVEASHFFDHVNHKPLEDPRVRLYQDDARHILLASNDTYDVMISEPSHPWVSGVANLFTRDFFALAARRLREDGIFTQWLQGYQIPLESFRSILMSFHSVFPEVLVFSPGDADDWLLIGSRHPLHLDLAGMERRWAEDEGIKAEYSRAGVEHPEHIAAAFYLSTKQVEALTAGAPVNSDNTMYVEFRAPRQIAEPRGTSGRHIQQLVNEHAPPIETVLADPATLTQNPARLRALLEGFEQQHRKAETYEQMLQKLEPKEE